ncbi:MAG: segregation and condensation protein A [Pseudomonadota bacterium]
MTEEAAVPESTGPRQGEMPFAVVDGEPYTELPTDLYIPPDALEVFLDTFEGPLDLLLYLIRRQNLDILDIPILTITRQYMEYVELMKAMRLELAAEYLVMAAMLAEIKSRMLLPRPEQANDDEDHDPRAELIRRLQEYERYKQAAEDLDAMPRLERDIAQAVVPVDGLLTVRSEPQVGLDELLEAFRDVMRRADMFASHHVEREPLSVRERMSRVLEQLQEAQYVEFSSLFAVEEGRAGVVVTLLALLELLKDTLVELVQNDAFAPIHVRVVQNAREEST